MSLGEEMFLWRRQVSYLFLSPPSHWGMCVGDKQRLKRQVTGRRARRRKGRNSCSGKVVGPQLPNEMFSSLLSRGYMPPTAGGFPARTGPACSDLGRQEGWQKTCSRGRHFLEHTGTEGASGERPVGIFMVFHR